MLIKDIGYTARLYQQERDKLHVASFSYIHAMPFAAAPAWR